VAAITRHSERAAALHLRFEAFDPTVRLLADAGYWSNEHIDSLRERGITPIAAADTTRDRPRKRQISFDVIVTGTASRSSTD
jgi:hypothetical protein